MPPFKIVVASKVGASELPGDLEYFPNAKDRALQDADRRPFGEQVDVVDTRTGLTVGRAYRKHPGTGVTWEQLR